MRPNCQSLWVPSWKCTLSLWLSCRGVPLFSELPRSISIGFCRLQTPSTGVSFDRWDLAGWLLLRTQSCLCYLIPIRWLGQSFPNLKKDNPFLVSVLWLWNYTINRFLVNLWKEERRDTAIFLAYNHKNVCNIVIILDYLSWWLLYIQSAVQPTPLSNNAFLLSPLCHPSLASQFSTNTLLLSDFGVTSSGYFPWTES